MLIRKGNWKDEGDGKIITHHHHQGWHLSSVGNQRNSSFIFSGVWRLLHSWFIFHWSIFKFIAYQVENGRSSRCVHCSIPHKFSLDSVLCFEAFEGWQYKSWGVDRWVSRRRFLGSQKVQSGQEVLLKKRRIKGRRKVVTSYGELLEGTSLRKWDVKDCWVRRQTMDRHSPYRRGRENTERQVVQRELLQMKVEGRDKERTVVVWRSPFPHLGFPWEWRVPWVCCPCTEMLLRGIIHMKVITHKCLR